MSYFIANTVKVENNIISLKGGDNNVIPRSNYWTSYEPERNYLFLWNILDRSVQLQSRSKLANKIINAAIKVENAHREKYPKESQNHGIGKYSFFQMRIVYDTSKDELRSLKDEQFNSWRDTGNEYTKENLEFYSYYLDNYEEIKMHIQKMHDLFEKETGIILQPAKVPEQAVLF
jgi:hypothetical protein